MAIATHTGDSPSRTRRQHYTLSVLPSESEIADLCLEIHLELMEIWTETELAENRAFDAMSNRRVSELDLQRRILEKLSLRCADQYNRFYSAIANWFGRAGIDRASNEVIRLSGFAFGQELYEFKNRCVLSPLILDIMKGLRTELEALHHHVIPNLAALLEERFPYAVAAAV
ncbi:MAG TPA: hypothetical protein VF020_07185 [Chthoniobacterales bacterium]